MWVGSWGEFKWLRSIFFSFFFLFLFSLFFFSFLPISFFSSLVSQISHSVSLSLSSLSFLLSFFSLQAEEGLFYYGEGRGKDGVRSMAVVVWRRSDEHRDFKRKIRCCCCARFQHTFGETQGEVGSRRGLDETLGEDGSRKDSMR